MAQLQESYTMLFEICFNADDKFDQKYIPYVCGMYDACVLLIP